MGVVNLRDAIILSLLKDGNKTRNQIEQKLKIQSSVAKQSLKFLKQSGFIESHRLRGEELYLITNNGRNAIEKILRKFTY